MNPTIGERLKSAREAKGVSLEDASHATKVQRKVLQAMEQDRLNDVLDQAYSLIFLKKYVSYLGLGSGLVQEYKSVYGTAPEPGLSPQRPQATAATPDVMQKILPVVFMAGILIAITALGYGGARLISRFHGPLKPSARVVSEKGKGKIKIHRTNTAPARREIPAAGAQAPSKLLVPKSQPLKLTVRTKADVWMQVKSDGSVIFQNVLQKGTRKEWSAREELELWTGNAGAMEFSLNGIPLESPGGGVKKGIRVTREGLKVVR